MFISTLKISFVFSRIKHILGSHGSGGGEVINWSVTPNTIAIGVPVYSMWMVTAPEEQVAP